MRGRGRFGDVSGMGGTLRIKDSRIIGTDRLTKIRPPYRGGVIKRENGPLNTRRSLRAEQTRLCAILEPRGLGLPGTQSQQTAQIFPSLRTARYNGPHRPSHWVRALSPSKAAPAPDKSKRDMTLSPSRTSTLDPDRRADVIARIWLIGQGWPPNIKS